EPPSLRRRAGDLPAQLAVRDGPVSGVWLTGAQSRGHRAAAGSRGRRGQRGFQRRRPSRCRPPHAPSGARRRAGAILGRRGGAESDGARRRPQSHAHGALPRCGRRARASRLPRDPRPDAARAPAAGDARLPDGLDDAAARVRRRAGRRPVAAPGDRARAIATGLSARGTAMTHRAPSSRRALSDARAARLMLAPALIALATLAAWPGLWVLWLSLQRRIPVFGIERFVGLSHYVFLATDPRFGNALKVTLLFTFVSVALELLLGVTVALALQGQQRGRRVAVALLLLPWALPSVVTARMFEWLYHPSAGLLNFLLGGQAINWLGEPILALPALIVADVWRTMPFVALLCYARVLTIAPDIYDAARVDGAVATIRDITLPLLRRVLLIALLFRTLDALRAFDLMFVLTGGGPANTTETLTVYAYRSLFQTLQLGFGAAIGVVVFVLVMLVAWAYLRAMAPQDEATA